MFKTSYGSPVWDICFGIFYFKHSIFVSDFEACVLRIWLWLQSCVREVLLCPPSLYVLLVVTAHAAETPEQPTRLLDRAPFDRITLNAANEGAVIDVLPLDLPGRRVPQPLPTEGASSCVESLNPPWNIQSPGIPSLTLSFTSNCCWLRPRIWWMRRKWARPLTSCFS